MIRLYIRFLIVIVILLYASSGYALTIEQYLMDAGRGDIYEEPGPEELERAERLFEYLFQGKLTDNMRKEWSELNFEIIEAEEDKGAVILLKEDISYKRGRGFYLFRTGSVSESVLEIPHSFSDLDTGTIGIKLALEGEFRSAAWNTVPRYHTGGGAADADMAQSEETYFTAYTRAFARLYPSGQIIQLHGFAKDKRRSRAGSESDIIISSGTRTPGRRVLKTARCLKENIPAVVKVYPSEVNELGATRNISGIVLRRMGRSGLIHIEISRPMRLLLSNNRTVRTDFRECIEGSTDE